MILGTAQPSDSDVTLFSIDPKTYEMKKIAKYPENLVLFGPMSYDPVNQVMWIQLLNISFRIDQTYLCGIEVRRGKLVSCRKLPIDRKDEFPQYYYYDTIMYFYSVRSVRETGYYFVGYSDPKTGQFQPRFSTKCNG